MSEITATIRDISGKRHQTAIDRVVQTDLALAAFAVVPGFGYIVLRHYAGRDYEAWLVNDGHLMARSVKWIDDVAEVEVLPNQSGEDRIVVEFRGFK